MRAAPHAIFCDDIAGRARAFSRPERIITAHRAEEVSPALEEMEEARRSGKWLAGYMAYEAGFMLEPVLAHLAPAKPEVPYLSFGIFGTPEEWPLAHNHAPRKIEDIGFTDFRPLWNFKAYAQRFDTLHTNLMAGNCYQGNLTFPVHARFTGAPWSGFQALSTRQPVRYAAFIDLDGPCILSRSPELFFRVDDNGFIETHPMKGTAPRGKSRIEDEAIVAAMLDDEKTLAENCMIVDLLRNDISRIAETGSVHVPKLFEIETYPTLHQMVSHVRARLLPDLSIADIFTALFPCGSITGAPKIAAMKILHELEDGPRGAYCGAIGHIAPTGAMLFNVAIRTVSLFADGQAVFNVGGGIVLDSTAEAEYREALLKARFVTGDHALHSTYSG